MSRSFGRFAALFFFLLLVHSRPATSWAEEPIPTDEIAKIVEDLEERLAEAWSRGTMDDIIAFYDEDATFETEWGTVFRGHDPLKRWLLNALGPEGKSDRRVGRATVSTAITADVIVTHGVTFYGYSTGVMDRLFHTRVLLKTAEGWKIAAEQIARPSTMSQDITAAP